jgi:coenzyme F420-reducing hydrogenase beta subunit
MIIHGEFAYQNLKVYIEDSKQYLRKVVLNTGETGNSNNKEDSLIRKGIDSVVKNRKCAGCEACVQVCPQNAIVFEQGLDSFLYPKVLNEKCMNCGLCTKTCPALNEKLASGEEHKVYACRHKSKDIVSLSTSGGIFSAISDWFLNQSGVVYGAVFNDKFQVVMKRATTVYDRDSMRGAKYVQCRVNDSFKQVESDLKKDKRVLFSGTPCQIAGLKQYLQVKRIDCEKLLTVDIFCHGVSPQYMFDQHIKELIDKYGEINEYRFRCKEAGWRGHNVKVSFKNGRSHLNDAVSNGYAGLYFKSLLMRSSCKQCKYASIDRRGDFSIGDFWGIERVNSQFDDNEGCSCVMINSTKGMKCFDAIKGNIMFEEHSLQECKQEALTKPVSESLRIDNFRNDLEKKGYAYCQRKYTDLSYYGKVSDIVYRMQYHFNRLSG